MKKLLRYAAVAVMGLALSTGVVSAATADIDTTGPDSYNKVEFKNRHYSRVENNNNLGVKNNNPQVAKTGDAKVFDNTTGGNATSGAARNDSMLKVDATVDNSGDDCGCVGQNSNDDEGTIGNTGPDSYNKIEFENKSYTSVKNNNNVSVENNNWQYASSGDAKVFHNTTGGDATSGDAENVSSAEVTLSVTN